MKPITKSHAAFARADLLALTGAIVALACVAVGMTSRESSTRAGCYNNLRQTGMSIHRWAAEHDELPPWLVATSEGGTRPLPGASKVGVAWVEFMSLSNELTSARVLACPADKGAKVAANFSNGANGFANSGFRANALSYFLSFHGYNLLPRSVVLGDRDFRPSAGYSACSRGLVTNALICNFNDQTIAWTNGVHGAGGHLLFADGSVEFTDSTRLRKVLVGPELQIDSGNVHFLPAR